jgi:hypothetical protein
MPERELVTYANGVGAEAGWAFHILAKRSGSGDSRRMGRGAARRLHGVKRSREGPTYFTRAGGVRVPLAVLHALRSDGNPVFGITGAAGGFYVSETEF